MRRLYSNGTTRSIVPFVIFSLATIIITTTRTSCSALSNPKPSTYYRYKSFKRLSVLAPAYLLFSKAATKILNFQPRIIYPANVTSYEEVLQTNPTDGGKRRQRQRRKVALVTGGNTGVGYETAKALVQDHGYEVILACRSIEKGIQACQEINSGMLTTTKKSLMSFHSEGRAVFIQPIDLTNTSSIDAFARSVKEQYDIIDVLINNAGRNSGGGGGGSKKKKKKRTRISSM